jgi:hypothetical protein
MKSPRLENRIRKGLALIAAALIFPALAYAGTDNGKGNDGQNNGNQNGRNKISVVPEANTVWVLIPFFGAVLFLSARQLFRKKAAETNDC